MGISYLETNTLAWTFVSPENEAWWLKTVVFSPLSVNNLCKVGQREKKPLQLFMGMFWLQRKPNQSECRLVFPLKVCINLGAALAEGAWGWCPLGPHLIVSVKSVWKKDTSLKMRRRGSLLCPWHWKIHSNIPPELNVSPDAGFSTTDSSDVGLNLASPSSQWRFNYSRRGLQLVLTIDITLSIRQDTLKVQFLFC